MNHKLFIDNKKDDRVYMLLFLFLYVFIFFTSYKWFNFILKEQLVYLAYSWLSLFISGALTITMYLFFKQYRNLDEIFTEPDNFENKPKNIDTSLIEKFEQLNQDLEKVTFYLPGLNKFDLKEYNTTPLQSLQILLTVFRELYHVNSDVNNTEIYILFNEYFQIGSKLMTTQNWDGFKKKHYSDITNNEFYNDLYNQLKKFTL
ncbi:hypothetical protein VBZ51_14230 [Maribacter sp. HS]|uniref:hypothetical protein n=1 Tax=Maribacter sp. HS TaxID=3110480 RepID=UPI003A8AEE99